MAPISNFGGKFKLPVLPAHLGAGGGGGDGGDTGDSDDNGGAMVMDMVLDGEVVELKVSKENGPDADCEAKVSSVTLYHLNYEFFQYFDFLL